MYVDSVFQSDGYLSDILRMLSARKIQEACSLAQKSGDHRLALLLAQAVGSHVPRHMIAQQLINWCELKVSDLPFLWLIDVYLIFKK